jgi:poly(A) polymerase
LREGLRGLSAERLGKEWLKLLAAPDPRQAVSWMARTGVLGLIAPEHDNLGRFKAGVDLTRDPELRLSLITPRSAEAVERTAAHLRLSNAQKSRLLAAVGTEPPFHLDVAPASARAALYRLGARTFRDRLMHAWAEQPHRGSEAQTLLAVADAWVHPRFPLNGEDVAAAGVPRGPALGQALRRLEQAWVDSGFALEREALLAQLGTWTETRS